jgi:Cohesin domain
VIRKALVASLLVMAAVQADTIVSIQPSSSNVSLGGSTDVTIQITGVSDLYAFQFDVGFDASVVSATSVDEGAFLPAGGSTFFFGGSIDNVTGSISSIADSLIGPVPGVSGSGMLATIQFQGIGMGISPIQLSNIILLDSNLGDIDFTSADGSLSTVPEPKFVSLLLIGLIGLLSLTRNRLRESR